MNRVGIGAFGLDAIVDAANPFPQPGGDLAVAFLASSLLSAGTVDGLQKGSPHRPPLLLLHRTEIWFLILERWLKVQGFFGPFFDCFFSLKKVLIRWMS